MRATSLGKTLPVLACAAILLTACSSDEGSTSPSPAASATATPAATAGDFAIGDYLDPITVTVAEPGPRPLLTWEPVDGAALYLVTVLDSSGTGYWTWEGTDTEVHVGGTAEPDAIGPYVFEDMTWRVAAQDDSGALLAVSQPSPLNP